MNFTNLFCHRDSARSILWKIKLPLCTRCTGFYVALLLSIVLFWFLDVQLTNKVTIVLFLILNAPLVIDGCTQYLKWRESNNVLRFITGILSGIGCGLALWHLIST